MSERTWRRWLLLAVNVAGVVPLAWLVVSFVTDRLSFNPIQAATLRTGDYALTFLWLSLACTPLSSLTGWRLFGALRRPLGLYAFAYAAVHALIFVGWDYGFDWPNVLPLFAQKTYLALGLSAFFLMALLAATSFGRFRRRKPDRWANLHRLVYPAAVLVLVHFVLVADGDIMRLKGDIWRPLAYAAVLAVMLVVRIAAWIRAGTRPAPTGQLPSQMCNCQYSAGRPRIGGMAVDRRDGRVPGSTGFGHLQQPAGMVRVKFLHLRQIHGQQLTGDHRRYG